MDADRQLAIEAWKILHTRCAQCHTGDEPKSGLRLDAREAILRGGKRGPAAFAGEPQASRLVAAVRRQGNLQMPPEQPLSGDEAAVLADWVEAGLPWPELAANPSDADSPWQYRPLQAAQLPGVQDTSWPLDPLDRFILARLEHAGVLPAPPTNRRTWLRRVYFDLIGLPPTREETERFALDARPDAHERVVDGLLASPHYGERWGRHWLDVVRYAETFGQECDYDIPGAWQYRDYVIRALNQDLSYEQFVREHVAGDLIDPRLDPGTGRNESELATTVWWLGVANILPVDIRGEACERTADQLNVLGKAFLSTTLACARCHDHKFDPIKQTDYYALAGIFESTRQHLSNHLAPQTTATVIGQLTANAGQIARALRSAIDSDAAIRGSLSPQVNSPIGAQPSTLPVLRPSDKLFHQFEGTSYGPWIATGPAFGAAPTARLTPVIGAELGSLLYEFVPGGVAHSGAISAELTGALRSPTFTIDKKYLYYRAWRRHPLRPQLFNQRGAEMGNCVTLGSRQIRLIVDGYQFLAPFFYPADLMVDLPPDAEPAWYRHDASAFLGHAAYIEILDEDDGFIAVDAIVASDDPTPPAAPTFDGDTLLDETSILARDGDVIPALLACLAAVDQPELACAPRQLELANRALRARRRAGQPMLAPSRFDSRNVEALLATRGKLESALKERSWATISVNGDGRNATLLEQGNPTRTGPVVPRSWLGALGGQKGDLATPGSGRDALARALVVQSQALVARVIVNRVWQHHFGRGIVATPDDFGKMGLAPSHPELLEYLAQRLIADGWSLKRLHRALVLSRTYRLSSRRDPAAEARDPDNSLWHRMPLVRLEAEILRDAMFAAIGNLDSALFGPPIPLPPSRIAQQCYDPPIPGPVDGRGRRSIYMEVRRNFASPLLDAFDFPSLPEVVGRRNVSNVPTQPLRLVTDPIVTEQARRMAELLLRTEDTDDNRLTRLFHRLLGRSPTSEERQMCGEFIGRQTPPTAEVALDVWSDLCLSLINSPEFQFVE